MSFLRPHNRPPFGPPEICIANVITEGIDLLRRDGTDVPAAGHLKKLSIRRRRVDLVELVQLCHACNIDPEQQIPEITHEIMSLLPRKRSSTPSNRPPIGNVSSA